jgi:predicted phosphodiesterase
MVLGFPCMADYTVIFDATDTVPARELFCTHGHIFGAGMHNSVNNLPALPPKSALVYGHTHIKVNEQSQQYPGLWLFNPGSVGIPKDGSHSFGIYEDGLFSHHVLTE